MFYINAYHFYFLSPQMHFLLRFRQCSIISFLIKNILYIRMLLRISNLTYMGHYVLAVTFYKLYYSRLCFYAFTHRAFATTVPLTSSVLILLNQQNVSATELYRIEFNILFKQPCFFLENQLPFSEIFSIHFSNLSAVNQDHLRIL